MNDHQIDKLLNRIDDELPDEDYMEYVDNPDKNGLRNHMRSVVRNWLLESAQPNSPYGFLILAIPDEWIQKP